MDTNVKNEKVRNSLVKELESVIKALISSPYSSTENIPSEITQNLCNTIEAIFIHGLKDPFFLKGTRYAKYPEPNFWPFVSKYSHRSITDQIVKLKQIKSEIGKSRAWIRIVLNERSLEHYLDLLVVENGSVQQFYNEYAFLRFLRDNEVSERVRGILKPLSKLPIYAATNSSFLNSWTPTPLILAGLMEGEPLRVGALASRRNPRQDSVSEEIAVPALDMLVPEEEHDIGSPNRRIRRPGGGLRKRISSQPKFENSEDDDNSSVYSHPSLLDVGEMSHQHAVTSRGGGGDCLTTSSSRPSANHLPWPASPLLTSTPVEKTIIDTVIRQTGFGQGHGQTSRPITVVPLQTVTNVGQSYEPLIVSRRTKRPSLRHSDSRSSSGSGSGSQDGKRNSMCSTSRQTRTNSDLPSTVFGTMPDDDVFGSVDEGIVFKASRLKSEGDNASDHSSQLSLLDAMNQLSDVQSTSLFGGVDVPVVEKVEKNIVNDVAVDVGERSEEETMTTLKAAEQIVEMDMKDESESTEPQPSTDDVEKTQKSEIEEEKCNQTEIVSTKFEPSEPISLTKRRDLNDSLLGTSLKDELDAISPHSNFFGDSPMPMTPIGNSLAAIGARNQMAWESMSERSRLSSSSDSTGPTVSFGQALRSAMQTERCGIDESVDTSAEASECDEPSSSRSRKSSEISVNTDAKKLCQLAREKGLDAQDFRCAMCRKSIGGLTYAHFETCGIDGMYYCVECMKPGGKSAIPARVLLDWDWRERSISDRGRAWIEANQEKVLIDVMESNSKLYAHVPALQAVKILREKLQIVSMYLFTCRESVAEDFKRRVWPKEYLYTNVHKFSFSDLIDVKSGAIQKRLIQLLKFATSHVMSCTLCKQKGFICELCSVHDVIYPFDTETTHRCSVCFSVYHKECWRQAAECPKCARRAQFEARRALIDEPHTVLMLRP